MILFASCVFLARFLVIRSGTWMVLSSLPICVTFCVFRSRNSPNKAWSWIICFKLFAIKTRLDYFCKNILLKLSCTVSLIMCPHVQVILDFQVFYKYVCKDISEADVWFCYLDKKRLILNQMYENGSYFLSSFRI